MISNKQFHYTHKLLVPPPALLTFNFMHHSNGYHVLVVSGITLLCAYSVAIGLLSQLAWIGFSLKHRCIELTENADVVQEAAAAAQARMLDHLGWPVSASQLLWSRLSGRLRKCFR